MLSDKFELGTSVVGYSNKYTMTEEKTATHSYGNINQDIYFTDESNLWESAQASVFLKYNGLTVTRRPVCARFRDRLMVTSSFNFII